MARTSPYFNPIGLNEDPLARLGGRAQQPLQQRADRRRRQQRRLRAGGVGHARRPDRNAADQPRRDPGAPAGRLARTTSGRADSPAAASTPSPRAARTTSAARATSSAATRTWSATAVSRHADRAASSTSSSAPASAGRSSTNKAFFFGNGDFERRDNPSGFSVSTHAARRSAAKPRSIASSTSCRTSYGYDPGRQGRIHPDDQQRQVLRPRRLQPVADHQLIARHNLRDSAQRHRSADARPRTSCRTASTASRTRRTRRSCQLNSTFGSAVNEAARHVPAHPRPPRRAAVRGSAVPAASR